MPNPQNQTDMQARVDAYVDTQSKLDLLRFITCGSVDDGKSTLIGRMLYEAQMIFEDQVTTLQSDSKKVGTQGADIDFALLVDGLAAEREQGITIDVAYRFFNTDRRKFIVADTPGHEQYTRNMVTGASTADVAIILIDASQGVLTQTRRHSFIASLLGIEHVVLAVNKMDLVGYSQDRFNTICEEYEALRKHLAFKSITPIPLSALKGDNVIERSGTMGWYQGPTLLGFLETVDIRDRLNQHAFRFPVQWVNRPNADFRGFSGTVVAGSIKPGDEIRALPSGQIAAIDRVVLSTNDLDQAVTDQAVTLTLDREIDLSRGDLIVAADAPCEVSDQFEAELVWMDNEPGYVGRRYSFQLGTSQANASLTDIKFKYDVNTFEQLSGRELAFNEIANVQITLDAEIPFEAYTTCPGLGAFVLIDRYTNATVAAGMIRFALRRSSNVHRQALSVDRAAREKLSGHRGRVAWLTGLSGSGKSTIANAAEKILHEQGFRTYILDGDNVRHGLSKDLGFTVADRVENIRRIAEVAKLMLDAGVIVLTAFISPFRDERDMAKSLFEPDDFLEVFVDTPLAVAEERDPKGLYKKARSGELPNFTGIDSEYQPPKNPSLVLTTDGRTVEESAKELVELISTRAQDQ
ncbi:sulfate adenylyltransferase subunit CysN [Luminiphilus sp.]|nr:sulfate adenylyltransferase subunit CysN [Luminiphilus sp.]MDA8754435.1 sulfate adenylyltransferase subunit CysN [Luminiphilus sp.]MDB2316762.1 sulfate adenylyltransferase subunit CysN [Luminiphilus sp.]MDB2511529.1 sulfate adenylyltransferase subunit CysN [Luminiphilus sp.]